MEVIKEYYDNKRNEHYGHELFSSDPVRHSHFNLLQNFILNFHLEDKKCLEIGSARGIFQDMVLNFTGTDIADSVKGYYHKPYFVAREGGKYPFADNSFDAIWTITVYEHIQEIDDALNEIRRILIPGGIVLFAPAWECTSWAAEGYPVRPYSDFGIKGKIIKFLIPLRSSILWRMAFKIPKRITRQLFFSLGYKFTKIRYKKLKPNYEKYWMSDSDACNSIDVHDAILWFESNGFKCITYRTIFEKLASRFRMDSGLVFQKLD